VKKPLRGAFIGFGFIAEKGHAPEYQRRQARGEVEIVGVVDVSRPRREAAHDVFPRAGIYADALELLERHGSELDFVDIAVPPYAHAESVRPALARGLHVLCEKPLATTPQDARSMASQALSARRVLFPCHNYRHAPVISEIRSVLGSGVIGQPRLVTLQTFRTTHARGVESWRPDWRRERRYAGGGIAMDHGSHTFYLAFEWLRSYPTSVTAKLGTLSAYDTEDNFSCTLTFPTGIATAHLTWTAGVRKVLYTLHGDQGAIVADDDSIVVHRTGENGKSNGKSDVRHAPSKWMDASHSEWFGGLFDDFRQAIHDGQYVSASTVDAIQCVATIDAAYESAARRSAEVAIPKPPTGSAAVSSVSTTRVDTVHREPVPHP
jgi:predicted dehydrogenase